MIKIVKIPIDIAEVIKSVSNPKAGAIDAFIGTTRDNFEGKPVLFLEYEAYEEMALFTIQKLVDEAFSKWNLCSVSLVHRVGRVDIGDVSIVIAVSSPHRNEAFEACRFLIDNVKKTVPIWKKEHFEGKNTWVGSEKR